MFGFIVFACFSNSDSPLIETSQPHRPRTCHTTEVAGYSTGV